MNKDTLRQIVVILALIVTLAVNGLANTLPLNNQSTGDISDLFDVYFVPAGYVFSIWGLIYVGLIAYAVYQALPAQRENPRLQRMGVLFVLSCIANAGWLFLWHYLLFPLSLWLMVMLLFLLIGIYHMLETGRTQVSAAEKWLVRVPFSIYLGWITVATVANATSVLDYVGWNGWGISPEAWTVIMLIAATGIGSAVSLTRGDAAYMLVLIWAFAGIAVKHTGTPIVMLAAWIAAGVVAIMLVVGRYVHQKRQAQ